MTAPFSHQTKVTGKIANLTYLWALMEIGVLMRFQTVVLATRGQFKRISHRSMDLRETKKKLIQAIRNLIVLETQIGTLNRYITRLTRIKSKPMASIRCLRILNQDLRV